MSPWLWLSPKRSKQFSLFPVPAVNGCSPLSMSQMCLFSFQQHLVLQQHSSSISYKTCQLLGVLSPLQTFPWVHALASTTSSVPRPHVVTQRCSSQVVEARASQREPAICLHHLITGSAHPKLLSLCVHRSPAGSATKESGIKRT